MQLLLYVSFRIASNRFHQFHRVSLPLHSLAYNVRMLSATIAVLLRFFCQVHYRRPPHST